MGNNHVDLSSYIDCSPRDLGITELVYYPMLKKLLEASEGNVETLKELVKQNVDMLVVKHILIDDIISTINYIII